MRLFDAINRWQVVAATLAVVVAVELGLYYFVYLPDRPSTPGPLQGRDLTMPAGDTAPAAAPETIPSPSGRVQYRP